MLRLAAEVFDRLSEQAQSTLLSARWEVASPAMVGMLRRCAEAESTATCGRLQGDLLLLRLNELSPGDAREVILGDMTKANSRFPARVLAILPDKELPEMDAVLREHLQSTDSNVDTTAELIERYATGTITGVDQSYLDILAPGCGAAHSISGYSTDRNGHSFRCRARSSSKRSAVPCTDH